MHCEKAKEWMACACTPPRVRHKNDSEVSTRKHYGARKKALAARATGAAGIWRMAPLARHCGMNTPSIASVRRRACMRTKNVCDKVSQSVEAHRILGTTTCQIRACEHQRLTPSGIMRELVRTGCSKYNAHLRGRQQRHL